MMIWGYFLKMVIADRAAIFVDSVFNSYSDKTGSIILLATILFAFQIYGDFGGYSIIAAGAAKILGIELMENFNSPYYAQSTAEFWRRWHVSLNTWFRDYIYIPLGGSRKGVKKKYINLIIVFFVSGLWHGARWNYVVWGLLNGFFQIIGSLTKRVRNNIGNILNINVNTFSTSLVRVAMTFVLIDFTWMFFRANRLLEAFDIIKIMLSNFKLAALFSETIYTFGLDKLNLRLLIYAIIFLMVVDGIKVKGKPVRTWILKQNSWFQILCISFGAIFVVIYGMWGGDYNANAFIYFQF